MPQQPSATSAGQNKLRGLFADDVKDERCAVTVLFVLPVFTALADDRVACCLPVFPLPPLVGLFPPLPRFRDLLFGIAPHNPSLCSLCCFALDVL